MSALRSMAAVLAGAGRGMVERREDDERKARQAKIDERADWQHNQLVEAANRENKLRTDLADAAAPRATMQGTVTESGGQKLFSADPGQAAQIKSMAESIAEMEGTGPVTQTQGNAITGSMSKGHQITTGPVDLAQMNSPEAESLRVQEVYRRNGLRDKYMQEFNANEAYKDTIKKRIETMKREGVTAALAHLRAGSPEQAMQAFQGSGEIKLPEGAKFVQLDGTDMHTGKPGKVWGVQGPDGQTIVADVGQMAAKYLGIEGMFRFDGDAAQRKQAAEDAARKNDLDQRRLDIQQQLADARDKQVNAIAMRLAGGGSGGGGGSRGGGSGGGRGDEGLPNPMSGFDPRKAYAVAADQAIAELSADGTPATPAAIAARATAIYRAMESEFRSTGESAAAAQVIQNLALMARTPAEMQSAAQMAQQAGVTIGQLAAIDPRYAQMAKPPEAPAQKEPVGPMTRSATPPSGIFRDKNGDIQLLQPFISMNQWRRGMVQKQNEADAAGGFTGGF